MKPFTTQQKSSLRLAGLASLATALVSFAVNKLIEIQLNFWMLLTLLVVGIGTFIYIDLTGKPKNIE